MIRRLPAALAAATLLLSGCTTPLERGEERYQLGDRRGALDLWRQIPSDSRYHDAAQQRIAAVEDEHTKLLDRYEQRARYFERSGRLAEAILSWRMAAKLEREDGGALAHVQDLSRQLATRKDELQQIFRRALDQGHLAEARSSAEALRRLDPFDPSLERDERAVTEALSAERERLLAAGRRGFSAGDYDAASQEFEAVLALEPENEVARGYLAYVDDVRESQRAKPAEAPPDPGPRAGARSRPNRQNATDDEIRAEGFHQNALAAERAGDGYAAIRHDLRALAASPNHARAREHLARLRAGLAPEVPSLIDAGRTAFQQEDLQSALDQWRRALLVEPDNERAAEYAARAEKLLQNLEQLRAGDTPPPAVGAQR